MQNLYTQITQVEGVKFNLIHTPYRAFHSALLQLVHNLYGRVFCVVTWL